MRSNLAAAFMLLTRLPVGWLAGGGAGAFAAAVWAYPLAGAAVGGIGAAVFALSGWAGLPTAVGAAWTLAAMLLTTGALHEDGLADTADGFGGGRTRERKLEIMRDSRIGSFGALALMLGLGTRWAALAALAHPTAALIAAGALSRAAMLAPLLLAEPARADGLAAALRDLPVLRAAAGIALAIALAVALTGAGAGLAMTGAAALAALAATVTARRQIGGYTGDVLGAACVVAECAALTAACAVTG